jgi:hypothetical protein
VKRRPESTSRSRAATGRAQRGGIEAEVGAVARGHRQRQGRLRQDRRDHPVILGHRQREPAGQAHADRADPRAAASSWAIAARWRSHATIGLVVPVAQVANSRATQTLARDAAV